MSENVDRIEVVPVAEVLTDDPIEPEEAPAKRVLSMPTTVSPGRATEHGPEVVGGPIRTGVTPVAADFAAGELAQEVGSRCAQCAHFRREDWITTYKAWERGSIAQQKTLDRFTFVLARALSQAEEPTLEELAEARRQIKEGGICAALTEIRRDLTMVHPGGGCPDGMSYYQPRDRAARRASSAAYDQIMRAAQGKS